MNIRRYSLLLIFFAVLALSSTAFSLYKPGALKKKAEQKKLSLIPPSQDGVSEDYWKVEENILLYRFHHGEGRPVLVIHGGPGIPPQKPWTGLTSIRGYSFQYYHHRGCGRSSHPIESFQSQNYMQNVTLLTRKLGMEAQLADIERIRRILQTDQVILIGHSYGGFMAVLYALEFPEHVSKLILISPADILTLPPAHGGMERIKDYLSPEGQERFNEFLKSYFDYGTIFNKSESDLASLNSQFGLFYIEALKKLGIELPEPGTSIEGMGGWMVHAIYFSLGMKYDFREYVKSIQVPSLVIHGEQDITPLEAVKEYADLLPDSKMKIIKDASHFPFEEQPDTFSKIVERFLNQGLRFYP